MTLDSSNLILHAIAIAKAKKSSHTHPVTTPSHWPLALALLLLPSCNPSVLIHLSLSLHTVCGSRTVGVPLLIIDPSLSILSLICCYSKDHHQPPSPQTQSTLLPTTIQSFIKNKLTTLHPLPPNNRLISSLCLHIAPKSNVLGPATPQIHPFSSLHPVLNSPPHPKAPTFPTAKSNLGRLDCPFIYSLRESSLSAPILCRNPSFSGLLCSKPDLSLAPNSARKPELLRRSAISG